ncbi:PRC-barrel domain-containing protein [Halomicrococcus sp. NG-SE-24]|uniref:PRC-barrel domain-containing protein n=1 Tax=unclassified Halomicrococcus TaxID=2614448 RepID=UPI000DE12D5F|nr:photosystem reaction center subunit H [halophilic archaeon]
MDESPEEITTLVGREVYSNNGVFVGEVDDVRLNLDATTVTGLALGRLNDELFSNRINPSQGVILPYRWVRAVGDVILVNDVVERMKEPEEEVSDDEVTV